jgi:hypothetical protein
MPELKDARLEQFSKLLATGMEAATAYAKVGYRPDRSNASKAARRPDVQARVQELQREEAERRALARGDGAEETGERLLRLAAEKALATGNLSALVQAAKEIGASDGSLEALAAEREPPATVEDMIQIAARHGPTWVLALQIMAVKDSFAERPDSDIEVCEEGLSRWFSERQLAELGRRLLSRQPTGKSVS